MMNEVEENNNNNCNSNSSNMITCNVYKRYLKYTKLHIYSKCGYIFPATNNKSYYRDRFEEHIKNCEGKTKRLLCLNEQSVPFIPQIQKK
jgi:hypothetical protein